MPRALRFHVPGDLYHVISRGNHRDDIFRDENDFLYYLQLLRRYSQRYFVTIHAYVLMTNHVHLLVQEGDQPLGRFMQGVQQSYTQYFNKRYEQNGHLFQGRYKAIRLDCDEYLLALVRYIHLNPIKAGLANDPADYPWSSHRHYYHGGSGDHILETKLVEGLMVEYGGREIADYELLSAARRKKPIVIAVDHPQPEQGNQPPIVAGPDLGSIMDRVVSFSGIPKERLQGWQKDKATSNTRWLFIYMAGRAGHTITSIANYLQRTASSVTLALQAVEREVEAHGPWADRIASFHAKTKQLRV